MSGNLLALRAPQLHRCQVYRYFSGLSRLYLSVMRPQQTEPAFFVLFSDVAYFSGPMGWTSADFHLAPDQACIDLLLQTGIIGEAVLQFPDAYASITSAAQLYVVPTGHEPVRIIASSFSRLDSIPANL